MDECYPKYYQYTPLPAKSVRLLKLRSGQGKFGGDGKIEIELTHHELGASSFDALSYTWGCSTLKEEDEAAEQIFTTVARCYPVICDDRIILATKSLRDKLRRLRELEYPNVKQYMASQFRFQKQNYLWVDGICIDQDNNLERGVQVAMMADIYKAASWVLIDLGDEDAYSRPGLELTSKLANINNNPAAESRQRSHQADLEHPEFWKRFGMSVPTAQDWWSWTIFLSRSWFSRTWVAQEALLANSDRTLVTCGRMSLLLMGILHSLILVYAQRWTIFIISLLEGTKHANADYSRYSANIEGWLSAGHPHLWIQRHWQERSKPSFYKLCRMLLLFTDCADPRDKVYGTLGIGAEWNVLSQPALPVDYDLSVREVYCRATKYAMRASGNLDLLTIVPARVEDSEQPMLPSWCPDYNSKIRFPVPLMDHGGSKQTAFSASPCDNFNLRDDLGRSDLLFLRGSKRDSIRRRESLEAFATGDMFLQVLGILHEMSKVHNIDGSLLAEALARTMISLGQAPDDLKDGRSEAHWGRLLSACWLVVMYGITPETSESSKRNKKEVESNIELLETYRHYRSAAINFPPKAEHIRRALQSEMAGQPRNKAIIQLFQDHGLDGDLMNQSLALTSRLHGTCYRRSMFQTSNGRIGIGHETVKEDDEVWLLTGSSMPLILRPLHDNRFKFVGETYVDGLMFGEGWPDSDDKLVDVTLE